MQTRRLSLPLQARKAELRAESFDDETHSVEVVWTTGAAVRRVNWAGEEYNEVLEVTPQAVRLGRLNSGAPLLDTHQSKELKNVIGSVMAGTAKISGGRGLARVKLSRAPGCADIVSNIREGVIRNISVGYIVHRVVEEEGRSGNPVVRVVDWEPLELSAVPIPADPGAQIRKGPDAALCIIHDVRDLPTVAATAKARMQARMTALDAKSEIRLSASIAREKPLDSWEAFQQSKAEERARSYVRFQPGLDLGVELARIRELMDMGLEMGIRDSIIEEAIESGSTPGALRRRCEDGEIIVRQ